jgi:predicted DNA-binding transcriptional regulator AlpA
VDQDFHPFGQDMMTLQELRARMGISQTSAYELAAKNALPIPVIRVGRQLRFSRRAWDQLLSSQHIGREREGVGVDE